MFDELNEECGIIGVFGHPEAANLTYLGLYSLQHRGQESAGIVSSDGSSLHPYRQMGLVSDIFTEQVIKTLPGHSAIGHVRYSTTGSSTLKNCQPIYVEYSRGGLSVAHNGNLVNAHLIREELENKGSIFQSTMDTEVIVHLLATHKSNSLIERIIHAMSRIHGSYSLLFLTESRLIAVRDPKGFRPLVLGKLKDAWIIASETCALDLIEAKFEREVEPGEIIVIDKNGLRSFKPFNEAHKAFCIFELVYFARPDSVVFGKSVYSVRKELGRQLAKEQPVDADIVVPVPDSGVPAALGFSEASGIPFEKALIRNHYVGRTFIEPQESIRHFGVKIKLNPVRDIVEGKRVILIDDSIVRGTTSRKLIKMVRSAGAREVHFRISSPPFISPCFYGIDTPTKRELIGASHTVEEINRYITSDTLGYLSIEGLTSFAGKDRDNYCLACFNRKYPVAFPWPPEYEVPQLGLFGESA